MPLKSFADTKVSLSSTQNDIENLLDRMNIGDRRWTHSPEKREAGLPGKIILEFIHEGRGYRIAVDYQYKKGTRGGNIGTTREQAGRALYWYTKNLFDAIEYGIVTLEQGLFPYMITDKGFTLSEIIESKPEIVNQLASGNASFLALEYQGVK